MDYIVKMSLQEKPWEEQQWIVDAKEAESAIRKAKKNAKVQWGNKPVFVGEVRPYDFS